MNRTEALKIIRARVEIDRITIRDGKPVSDYDKFVAEQDEALEYLLRVVDEPDTFVCGSCELFGDEDASGDGWCYEHDRFARCGDKPCRKHEYRKENKPNEA